LTKGANFGAARDPRAASFSQEDNMLVTLPLNWRSHHGNYYANHSKAHRYIVSPLTDGWAVEFRFQDCVVTLGAAHSLADAQAIAQHHYDGFAERYAKQHAKKTGEQHTVGMDESNAMFVVVSDLDDGAYGPFFILARAVEYAEVAGGTVFRLQPIGADEGRAHHA
jgi:hypothetical protein